MAEQAAQGRPGVFGRVLRGSVLTAGSQAASQAMRLAANLILARLLFPEAFGLMALVSVVLVGLQMLSDTGIGPAIAQHPEGDAPAFLDTAFTLNLVRGVLLWLVAALLAAPLSQVWGQPDLSAILPVAALTLVIQGLSPTRIETANRHLLLGRVTALDLAAQAAGILAMVALALMLHSVWALVLGAVAGSLVRLFLMWGFLPGRANRLAWDPKAGRALFGFGRWIFLSTACGFLLAQGDKAILGTWLPLGALGVYNIGFFLASFPVMLAGAVNARVMIPVYRDHHPREGTANGARLRRLRLVLTGLTLLALGGLGLLSGPLVGILYDARYAGAAPVMAAVAVALMPGVVGMTYDQAALAAGNARHFFAAMAVRAGVQTVALLIGLALGGLGGALAGLGLAGLAGHAAQVWIARRHGVWDERHDIAGFALALLLALAVWLANPVSLAGFAG